MRRLDADWLLKQRKGNPNGMWREHGFCDTSSHAARLRDAGSEALLVMTSIEDAMDKANLEHSTI